MPSNIVANPATSVSARNSPAATAASTLARMASRFTSQTRVVVGRSVVDKAGAHEEPFFAWSDVSARGMARRTLPSPRGRVSVPNYSPMFPDEEAVSESIRASKKSGCFAIPRSRRLIKLAVDVLPRSVSQERKSPTEPRRRDRARTEAALIEAAQAEFSIHGFRAATTRAIAARVGCSEALIQNYFGGKEGLLMAVMRAGAVDQGEVVSGGFFDRPRPASAEAEAHELLAFIVGFMRRLAPRLRILLDRVLLDAEFARRFADMTPRRTLVAAVAARLRREWPATVDPDRSADAIVSFGFELGFVYPELLGRGEQEVDAFLAHYAAMLAPTLQLD